MSRQRSIYTYLFFLFALLACYAQAQEATVVSASVNKTAILIGEPIDLTLSASIPQKDPIRFFYIDTINHFEFLEKGKIDTNNTKSGTELSQLIRITSFDSGSYVIPAFVLRDSIFTDSIAVRVNFSSPFDSSQPYHGLKDVIDVAVTKKEEEWLWYAVAAGVLLLALILYFIFRKKKKPVVVATAPPPDYFKDAMEQLSALEGSTGDRKSYYTVLTSIFRNYVAGRWNIQSNQQTTGDLVVQLQNVLIPKEEMNQLTQALRLSDFVKFAKYVPTASDDAVSFNRIKKSIQAMEALKA